MLNLAKGTRMSWKDGGVSIGEKKENKKKGIFFFSSINTSK